RCNAVDAGAVCGEDRSQPMCICSTAYTGTYCSAPVAMYERMDAWLGPQEAARMQTVLGVAQSSPAALISVLPSVYALLTPAQKTAMGWAQNEMIDSIDFGMSALDINTALTSIFDEQLGNCFTFNYANETNNGEGLHRASFAGQHRALSVTLKLHPSEQVAWVESTSISTFIHAPGTPPNQGITYSLRGAAADLIGLRKGCYTACYQDKVLEKCGCMDARMKKATSATQCQFKDKDCVDSVTAQLGEPPSWAWCKCPPECYKEEYAISATRAALPIKLARCANATGGCPDQRESIARLTVYLESLESEIYVEVENMPFFTMLSNIGGQLGFLLGMSIVGIIELLTLCATLGKD
ncbi:hypothetical protein PMAYCL1PPCAC_03547, partial [Pristionchus mayeri]